jgi:hypothetical protein
MAWASDYITSAELKAFKHISDTDDDAQVAVAVTAASRSIDAHTNRQFGVVAAAEQRFYTAVWDRRRWRWVVEVDDFMSTTNMVVSVDAGTITAFTKEPVNNAAKGRPWEQLVVDIDSTVVPTTERGGVSVTAIWGWSAVPTAVKQATYLQASRFLARRDSPFGVAGSLADGGSELRLLARVDPDVAVSLTPYVRRWAAV